MIKNVTYFDVEWANSINKSICQIGLICEDYQTEEDIIPEQNLYINPEDSFDQMCVNVHGISSTRVAEEKTFPEIWDGIKSCFTNSVVIGHNVAAADLNALVRALSRYNLDIPELFYIDTWEIARDTIPEEYIDSYSLSSLCRYFSIEIGTAHDAFDDACACKDVLKSLIRASCIDLEQYVRKYDSHPIAPFNPYFSDPLVRKAITDYYGIVRGIMADSTINEEERCYLMKWKHENADIIKAPQLQKLVNYIDEALSDNLLTEGEKNGINAILAEYYSTIKASPETTATQILSGILKGLAADSIVSEAECRKLQEWLYNNAFLKGHFPYDRVYSTVEEVLEDGIVTKEESDYLIKEIAAILNPVEQLKSSVDSIEGKIVCLSGNFKYGPKSAVAEYVRNKGGVIEEAVKKNLDILVVGDSECMAYANGTYGTKVKKAIEYNNKGSHIKIIKESDLFKL